MTTRTEQEIRRGAPVRGTASTTVPTTGRRRPSVPQQSRPAQRPTASAASRPAAVRRPARGRQRAPFVLLVVGLLCGGLVSLLLLNTVLAEGSIQETTLRNQIETERMKYANAKENLLRGDQPGAVAEDAEKQAMRPDWAKPNPLQGASESTNQVGQNR